LWAVRVGCKDGLFRGIGELSDGEETNLDIRATKAAAVVVYAEAVTDSLDPAKNRLVGTFIFDAQVKFLENSNAFYDRTSLIDCSTP
jgi:hypothetical protein